MKKYLLTFFCSILIIICIFSVGGHIKNSIPYVEVVDIVAKTARSTVVCPGTVEYIDSKEVFPNCVCIIKNINVKVGDKVSKGDTLMSANKAKLKDASSFNMDKDIIKDAQGINDINDLYGLLYNNDVQSVISNNYRADGPYFNIVSPMDGVVSSVQVSESDTVTPNKAVITISSKDKLGVSLSINEAQISDIKLSQKVIITGSGFKGNEYMGKIDNISNEACKTVGISGKETIVNATAGINEFPSEIKPGFSVKCKIITSENDNAVIIPYQAVKADNDGREYVYKYCDKMAVKSYITTKNEYEDGFEVESGVNLGEKIVANPDLLKRDGYVKIKGVTV